MRWHFAYVLASFGHIEMETIFGGLILKLILYNKNQSHAMNPQNFKLQNLNQIRTAKF